MSLSNAKQTAWHSGNLKYLLKPCQREMRQRIIEWGGFKFVIKCSRRLGKSFLLALMANEKCLSKPGALVRFAAPTHKALKKIIIPIMNRILKDCPLELRPEFKASEGVYVYHNKSEIHLAGVNLQPEHLRGTACDLFLIDEAGSVENLDYLIHDIAMPQFLDPDGQIVSERKLIIASSPAITPAHEFTEMAKEAEIKGNYAHFDIYQGGYSNEMVEKFAEECGGKHTTTWLREYMALDVVDEERAIVPEWKSQYEQLPPIDEYFQFYLKFEALDIGIRDLTVCLFAYYDFKKATLFVIDEYVINGPKMTTEVLARGIKEKEKEVFGDYSVYRRVSDIDLLLIQDLSMLHGLSFHQTDKGKLEEMVNEVRIWVNQGRIVVSPKCTQLCGSLRYGVWNERKTDFERSKAYGHFDALAALIYLVRNTNHSTNPVPRYYGKSAQDHVFLHPERNSQIDTFKKMMSIKKGNRV